MAYRHGLRARPNSRSCAGMRSILAAAFHVARRKNGAHADFVHLALKSSAPKACAARAVLLQAAAGPAARPYVLRYFAGRSNDVSHDPFHSYSGRQGCRHQFPSSSSHAARHATASSDGPRPGCASNALPRAQEYSTHDTIYRAEPAAVQGFLEGLEKPFKRVKSQAGHYVPSCQTKTL
jgi:hypothetical protein